MACRHWRCNVFKSAKRCRAWAAASNSRAVGAVPLLDVRIVVASRADGCLLRLAGWLSLWGHVYVGGRVLRSGLSLAVSAAGTGEASLFCTGCVLGTDGEDPRPMTSAMPTAPAAASNSRPTALGLSRVTAGRDGCSCNVACVSGLSLSSAATGLPWFMAASIDAAIAGSEAWPSIGGWLSAVSELDKAGEVGATSESSWPHSNFGNTAPFASSGG